jgi:hypothetical protein
MRTRSAAALISGAASRAAVSIALQSWSSDNHDRWGLTGFEAALRLLENMVVVAN